MEIITNYELLGDRADEVGCNAVNSKGESISWVKTPESTFVRKTVATLKNICQEKGLTGLSAPQIGIWKRIIVVNFDGDIRAYVNPIYTNREGMHLSKETCSSIPGKKFIRPRYNVIEVAYQKPTGEIKTQKFLGLAAEKIQHEIDHLDGLMLSDVGLEIEDDFENASEEERQEVINAYLDSLDIKKDSINTEIRNDETLSKIDDAINFINSVNKGDVTFTKEVTK